MDHQGRAQQIRKSFAAGGLLTAMICLFVCKKGALEVMTYGCNTVFCFLQISD